MSNFSYFTPERLGILLLITGSFGIGVIFGSLSIDGAYMEKFLIIITSGACLIMGIITRYAMSHINISDQKI